MEQMLATCPYGRTACQRFSNDTERRWPSVNVNSSQETVISGGRRTLLGSERFQVLNALCKTFFFLHTFKLENTVRNTNNDNNR